MPPDLLWWGIVHIISCLDEGLGSQLTFTSPPLGAQMPPWELPLPSMWINMWLLSMTDWGPPSRKLRSSQWQKPNGRNYYDQKIGTMELKLGNLVLVKADAFKGRRKIKDRWEDETCEVMHQITTDIPSYEMTDQHGQSHILHNSWLLLITSETGILLCVGVHQAWDQCTSPTPVSQLPKGMKVRLCHK